MSKSVSTPIKLQLLRNIDDRSRELQNCLVHMRQLKADIEHHAGPSRDMDSVINQLSHIVNENGFAGTLCAVADTIMKAPE